MQFPMAKGTEVLLTFVDGDPDRPLIAGAINTAAAPGPVTAGNQTESVIQTGGANKIRMEDKFGSERVMIESPASNSWIRVGATNDPITLHGDSPQYVDISSNGSYSDPKAIATDTDGKETPAFAGVILDLLGAATTMDLAVPGEYIVKYTNANDVAYRRVVVRDPDLETDLVASENDGIRLQSAGSLWLEAKSRYGEYYTGKPPKAAKGPAIPEQADMLAKFGASYNPTNLLMHSSQGAATTVETTNVAIAKAHVKVSSMDTFTTQEGNIYDFGGYWNYNLGNSYAEEHIWQSPKLNEQHAFNWPAGKAGDSNADYHVGGGIAGAAALVATTIGIVGAGSVPNASSIGGAIACGVVNGAVAGFIGAGLIFAVRTVAKIGPEGENFQGNIGDVIEGPGSNKVIKTWAEKVGSSYDSATKKPRATPDDDYDDDDKIKTKMNTDTTWVTKQFGDAYEFNRGNELSIRIGNTEEHMRGNTSEFTYGGVHEETKFNGDGRKVNYERGGGGSKTEINWHHVTGQLTNYTYKSNSIFSYEGSFVAMPTFAISTSVSSLRASVDISVGAMDIKASLAVGITMDIKGTAGLAIEFERSVGGKLVNDETTQAFEFKAVGMKAAKKAAMEADAKNLVMEKVLTQLGTQSMKVEDTKMTVRSGQMTLDGSSLKFF
jgi:hypothetical protein